MVRQEGSEVRRLGGGRVAMFGAASCCMMGKKVRPCEAVVSAARTAPGPIGPLLYLIHSYFFVLFFARPNGGE